MCFLVLLNNKEPVSKGQDQQPLEQVAKPCAENNAKVASSKANDSMEEPAETKKNKRERKEERQKKRKKEKKEQKLENHQENSKSQKPKKRKAGQEAEQEAAGKKSQRKRSKAERTQDGAVDGGAEREGETKTSLGKRKRKHSEGLWLAYTPGFVFCFVFFINLFIFVHLWLRWVFVAARRLSLVAASGGSSSLWCTSFSLWWLPFLRSTGCRCSGFSSCGSQALERRLSSCGARA